MGRKIFAAEHDIFRDAFRKFLVKEIVPHLDAWEEEGIVPRDAWKKMGEYGYLCPTVEEGYGGSGVGFEYAVIIVEEMFHAGVNSFWTHLHSDVVVPYLATFGNEAQKERWLPGSVSGDIIAAIAMTEPGAGSDLSAIRTTAVKDGDDYIINGQKTFISNGLLSDVVIVVAKTDPKANPPHKGMSLICVERDTPGFSRGRKLEKMGFRAQDTAELTFADCRVPAANLLGQEGQGFYYLMQKLQTERLEACVIAQSIAEAMLDVTVKYCKERFIFGQPVSSFQHNTFKIVDMATEIELGRTYVDAMIADYLAKIDITKRVSMGKAWLGEMANRVAYHCVQLHGGYGYMEEYPICRYARDARVITIFAGTTEVMKVIVGRMMGL